MDLLFCTEDFKNRYTFLKINLPNNNYICSQINIKGFLKPYIID